MLSSEESLNDSTLEVKDVTENDNSNFIEFIDRLRLDAAQ
jgi:hypothetical protein